VRAGTARVAQVTNEERRLPHGQRGERRREEDWALRQRVRRHGGQREHGGQPGRVEPDRVCTANAASTPSADRVAPTRAGPRGTRTATARLATTARKVSARLMFIQPPSPNTSATTPTGTTAATKIVTTSGKLLPRKAREATTSRKL